MHLQKSVVTFARSSSTSFDALVKFIVENTLFFVLNLLFIFFPSN